MVKIFKHIRTIAVVCSAMATFLSCSEKIEPESADNIINITVNLDKDDLIASDGTKVTFDNGNQLKWEGNESVGIIFAKASAAGTEFRNTCELKSVTGKPGVFAGDVNFGEFTTNDIIGIVCPYNEHSWGKTSSSGNRRIVMEVGAEDQIQEGGGRLNGKYCPLFAEIKLSDFKISGNKYTLEGKKLRWGCGLFRFDVYGKHAKGESGEKLVSVELFATTTICCAGTAELNIGSGFSFIGNTSLPYLVSKLSTPETLNTDESASISLYAASLPRGVNGNSVKFTRIFIVTDKAVYQKSINKSVQISTGDVLPVKLDIATFERTSRSVSSKTGRDSLMFISSGSLRNRPVKVYYYNPSGFSANNSHFLFAMHGSGRTGLAHLKIWEATAASKKVFVMAPEFTKELYSVNKYQFGGISSSSSEYDPQPYESWTYCIIEELFDLFKKAKGSGRTGYDMWGHSAGCQFTHRFLLNMPDARVERAVGSNAGSYTVPDPTGISDGVTTYGFPYSIKDMNIGKEQLKKYFSRDYTVHLGTADIATTVEQDGNLPVGPGAEAQGACRLERGHFFYNRAKRVADSLGLPFNWKLVEVPGVGHSGTKMAQTSGTGAASLLFP